MIIYIDVGWYEKNSKFKIILIQKFDWDNPVVQIHCDNHNQVLFSINFCFDYYNNMIMV